MAFVNLSLLFGTLLVGVPIVLHLVMRPQPKPYLFPAIRFIQPRQEANRRSLRLRHWLLLLLRGLVIALAALALARPRVSSPLFGNWTMIVALALLLLLIGTLLLVGAVTRGGAALLGGLSVLNAAVLAALVALLVTTLRDQDASLVGDRQAPVAAVMVFDASPRMQYREANQTRLERAQALADQVVRQLPPDSQVAVLDSRAIAPAFAFDLAAARKTIERVKLTGAPRALDQLLHTALQLLDASHLPRKEIYLYSDLTAAAWDIEGARLRERLAAARDVAVYVIDVGVQQPENLALGAVELSSETVPVHSALTIRAAVSCVGAGGAAAVELLVEDFDPTLPVVRDGTVVVPTARVHDRQEISLSDGETGSVEFSVRDLTAGTRHAEVRLAREDALAIDNQRHLTVLVRDPWLVLIVAPRGVDTTALVEAIAPYEHRVARRAVFQCLVSTPDELPHHSLGDFAAVVLLDPAPLPAGGWEQLAAYVRGGGQLALFLGPQAGDGSSFNEPAAQAVLPGKLGRPYRTPGGDVYLAPHGYDHPILRPFRPLASSVPWGDFPVFRHWSLHDLVPQSAVILRYSNQQPALIEHPVGSGTVVTMTTPITEPDRPRGRSAWNELAGPNDWPRFILVNQILRFLVEHDAGRFNYEAGQSVVLSNRADRDPARYLLFTPDGETQPVQARDERLMISATDAPGSYRLKGERDGPVTRGFSVTLPERASRLERTTRDHLDESLGAGRYQLARNQDEIVRVQGRQREGREFFPFLLALVVVGLVLEHLLANRFYRDVDAGKPA